jgi:fused signal recognition particle receptor
MVCGVNGTGKTTTIAKLAKLFQSQGKSVVSRTGDTFRAPRPAAHDLESGSAQRCHRRSRRTSPRRLSGVAGDRRKDDVTIIDTAGRRRRRRT